MIRNEWLNSLVESLENFNDTAESKDEQKIVKILIQELYDNLEWEQKRIEIQLPAAKCWRKEEKLNKKEFVEVNEKKCSEVSNCLGVKMVDGKKYCRGCGNVQPESVSSVLEQAWKELKENLKKEQPYKTIYNLATQILVWLK